MSDKCYTYEKRHYKDGFFNSFIDATYVITMENSTRKIHYENQLKMYVPTKIVYIVHNKGYKKCTKNLYKQQTNYDLIDANLNIMNHSLKNNYENILILEDDFIFNKTIVEFKIINEIRNFFYKNKNKIFYFNLGHIPILYYIIPDKNIYKAICSIVSQGIIYNKNILKNIVNDKDIYKKRHIDLYLHKYNCYFYKFPLVLQTFPKTLNQENWLDKKYIINRIILKLVIVFYAYLNLDGETNNYDIIRDGWYNIYNIFSFLNFLLNIIIIFIIAFIINYIYKNSSYKRYKR